MCDRLVHKPFVRDFPIVCTGNKCLFRYLELNVCRSIHVNICPSSIAADLRENDVICDLLICMTYATATSQRREIIFDPFPDAFQDRNNKPNYDAVVSTLNLLPSVEEMKKHCENESQLRAFLDGKGDQVYLLLWWILSCKRIALMKLPTQKQIKELPTTHQYLMQMDTPAKDKQFAEWRKKYGSYFAWHGSGLENWSSIMRKGLMNASNTKLMTTGAAYGPGIYMAPNLSVSLGYARMGASYWPKSQFRDASQLQCLALCEVVKHPNVPTVPNPYFVIRQEECVATRFFIFFTGD
jgi:poly [ADP-ribose] polymerase 6/8